MKGLIKGFVGSFQIEPAAPGDHPQEARRRDSDRVAEIEAFVQGLVAGSVTHPQVAAFAMAVFFRGMTMDERVALTRAMTRSGTVLDWTSLDLPGPVLDKHSTGGVGDNVSLMLGPIIAACGGVVPMISGRGLGHTGGTLDKLDLDPRLPDPARPCAVSAGWCARRASPSSARRPISPPPTRPSMPSVTLPRRWNRSR